jgi:hypothetical protein
LPPASVTRSGTTLPLLTRSERCSGLEEPVDYLKCVFSAFYRGGHLFRWVQQRVVLARPRGIGCPRGEFPVPAGAGLSPSPSPCPMPSASCALHPIISPPRYWVGYQKTHSLPSQFFEALFYNAAVIVYQSVPVVIWSAVITDHSAIIWVE